MAGNSSRHSEEVAEVEVDPGGEGNPPLRNRRLIGRFEAARSGLGVVEKRVPKMDGSARKAAFYLPGLRTPRQLRHHLEDLR